MRLLISLAAAALATSASAHVTVSPQQSAPGAREKYEIRIPNEKTADTIAVEVHLPAGLKATEFEQKPGWSTELERDRSGAIVGARWSGKLAPLQFTEFGLLAANPATSAELVFTATQFYADGTRIEWSGPATSKTPAARVTLKPAPR
ncbi:MAG: DUF1775 domain-containing protein [Sphingomicrobium sp.]